MMHFGNGDKPNWDGRVITLIGVDKLCWQIFKAVGCSTVVCVCDFSVLWC